MIYKHDLKVSKNACDYKNNYENFSQLKPHQTMITGNINSSSINQNINIVEKNQSFNERLSESKSLTYQINNPQDTSKGTTYVKKLSDINIFSTHTELHNKNNKIKKMFSGIGNQMKNAINAFDEVKEQIKYTAKVAKTNMNYPFCKAPCNIENIKNTIYINEEEIVINKKIYNTIFKKKKEVNDNTKKNENEEIFTCSNSDIVIKGNYNFGLDVDIKYENEENKIIIHAYDKETKKKIPCSYKWNRIYPTSNVGFLQTSLFSKRTNIYDNEYELSCEDIGVKIVVECSCITSEQVTVENLSKFHINSSENSEQSKHLENLQNGDINSISAKNIFENGNLYNNYYSEESSNFFYADKKPSTVVAHNNHLTMSNNAFQLGEHGKKNTKIDGYKGSFKENTTAENFSSFENSVFNNSTTNTNVSISNTGTDSVAINKNKKHYGIVIIEVGPFNLNVKTKKMLEGIIHNDTIRYPIYIIKKVYRNKDKNNENSLSDVNEKKKTYNEYDNNIADNNSLYSNLENESDMIYMLHIHKNEIKIIDQDNKMKHMWNYKFNQIYPFVEFLENNYHFALHVNTNEYYVCKCLYKRHRNFISIILRYMHANLYIINDYIFNNINQNFENTRVKNIFDNIDVNSILECINKELYINQKIIQKCMHQINRLKGEKNMLEDELKSTIEGFQSLDNIKKNSGDNDLIQTNDKLMKEIKILQDKYRNVDLFFKNKYKLLINDIEKYKKLVEDNKSKDNSEMKELYNRIGIIEKEKIELLDQNIKINSFYIEEKSQRAELENKLENLNSKLDCLNKCLQKEKLKGNENAQYIKEINELKTNNSHLQKKNLNNCDEINLLITEKNRLAKLVDSLTKDIEKLKMNENLKSSINQKDIINKNENADIPNNCLQDNQNLLNEVVSLRNENELLKKRIKKFANISLT